MSTQKPISPSLQSTSGSLIAVDAPVAAAPVDSTGGGPSGGPRSATRPYPKEWERHATLQDGTAILVRPLRPDDEPLYAPFFAAVTDNDVRLRFFAPVKEFGHAFLTRLIQIDYARAMAFIAIDPSSGKMLGVVRLHRNANDDTAEYAILVRSDLKGRGLGWLLMQMIIDYARAEGLHAIEGQVLRENTLMLTMCKEFGFDITPDPQDVTICIARLAIVP
jgi:acetyltransferase